MCTLGIFQMKPQNKTHYYQMWNFGFEMLGSVFDIPDSHRSCKSNVRTACPVCLALPGLAEAEAAPFHRNSSESRCVQASGTNQAAACAQALNPATLMSPNYWFHSQHELSHSWNFIMFNSSTASSGTCRSLVNRDKRVIPCTHSKMFFTSTKVTFITQKFYFWRKCRRCKNRIHH